jgi:hypothetical protein
MPEKMIEFRNDQFSLPDKVILIFLAANYVVITGIPGLYSIFKIIYFVQLGIFVLYLSIYFDFDYIFNYRFRRITVTPFLIIISFLLFFISSFIVNWNYNSNWESIFKLLTYPIVFYLFFVHLARLFFYYDNLFEKFLNVLVLIAFFTALIALTMYFLGLSLSNQYQFAATGYFGHPNTAAFIYTLSIPILFYKRFTNKYSNPKFILFLVTLMGGLLFSFSRSAYLGVFISILVITYKKSKKIFAITVVLSLFIIAYLFLGFATAKGDSSSPRILLIFASLNMIFNYGSRYLLWGYGIFHNIDVFKNESILVGSTEGVPDPHNMIMLSSIQFGLLFTVCLALIVAVIIAKTVFNKKENNSFFESKINLLISIIIGLIAHNMLEDIICYPEYYVMPLFLTFLGYLFFYSSQRQLINQ